MGISLRQLSAGRKSAPLPPSDDKGGEGGVTTSLNCLTRKVAI